MHFTTLVPTLLSLSPLVLASPFRLAGRGSVDATCGNIGAGANKGLTCSSGGIGGSCCSANGWCGDTSDYCGTGCQAAFGRCDTGTSGPGTPGTGVVGTPPDTSGAGRQKPGNIPYGVDIYNCATPGTVALTFDDGPYLYTADLLNKLAGYGAKATFFVTGSNLDKGDIDDSSKGWDTIIRGMESGGHQIASHTWTHRDLSTLSETERRDEMTRLETALVKIIGKYPTYMRPPYSSCTGDCVATMRDLGYHIIYFDLDTDDYNQLANIQVSRDNVARAVQGTSPNTQSFLSIAHDIHTETVNGLVPYMLETFKNMGYRMVTLGECLGDPQANWYRT